MSLTIIKAGILDTIQDEGRTGFRDLGINPGGSMDLFSARLAYSLLGKEMNRPVLEIHFPAPVIAFNEPALITITGANFIPCIQDEELPLNQPILITKGAVLQFKKCKWGARCYMAMLNDYTFPKWLGSYSTNIKAAAGGLNGGTLKKDDLIPFQKIQGLDNYKREEPFSILPWYAQPPSYHIQHPIEVIKGPEWDWLDDSSKDAFLNHSFSITSVADRMGYRLSGNALQTRENNQLVSSGVSFGIIQLLPSGQLIVLMADHQTTGGYPRIATITSTHLPRLAQSNPDDAISFHMVGIERAEAELMKQAEYLQSIQTAAQYKIEKWLA